MSRTLRRGNRLAVPRQIAGRHFLYRTRAPILDSADAALIVEAVQDQWSDFQGEAGCHIEVFSAGQLAHSRAGVAEALGRLSEALRLPITRSHHAAVLACHWAPPHIDESFAGVAFYSTVIHTGPYPYVMQTLDMEANRGSPELPGLHTNSRILCTGDAFVFDPTTPHWVMPQVSHQEALLILLQTEVADADASERARLLTQLPPLSEDADEREFTFP